FEDGGAAEETEDGDREDRDGDRGGDGESDLEREVNRRGREDHPQHGPEHDGAYGELGDVLGCGNVRHVLFRSGIVYLGLARGGCGHGGSLPASGPGVAAVPSARRFWGKPCGQPCELGCGKNWERSWWKPSRARGTWAPACRTRRTREQSCTLLEWHLQ